MDMRLKLTAGVVAVAALAAAAFSLRPAAPGAGPEGRPASSSDGWAMIKPGAEEGARPAPGPAVMTPEQVRQRLFRQGSFAGTEPSGDWCVAQGKLGACAALRHRFEY